MVGFLTKLIQSYDAVPYLRKAGVIELLAPFFVGALLISYSCNGLHIYTSPYINSRSPYALHTQQTYDLLHRIEITIPKITSLPIHIFREFAGTPTISSLPSVTVTSSITPAESSQSSISSYLMCAPFHR